MPMNGSPTRTLPRPTRRSRFLRSGFSLVEVMAASCVLMLGLGGTVLTVKTSLATISHSRHLGVASQVMQSEIERLRLRSWTQIQAIQDSGDHTVAVNELPAGSNLSCTRRIADVRDGLKEITIETTWGGGTGRVHTARLVTRYARSGLNDYFYTSH
jgi:Tfp pilus assembly protein PilV